MVCSADKFFELKGKYEFDRKRLSEAHQHSLRMFLGELHTQRSNCWECGGSDVDNLVVDNTNTTMDEMTPYLAAAAAYNYTIEVVTLDTPPEVAHARNVHGVPLETVQKQYERLMKTHVPAKWNPRVIKYEDHK